jgi:LPXTG-motif cell wall-anchored protein
MMYITTQDVTPSPSVAPNAPPTAGAVTPSASVGTSPPAEKLPTTGIDTSWMLWAAIVLVVLGAAALAVGRRRRTGSAG